MAKEKLWSFWAQGYDRLWVQKYSLGPTRREVLQALQGILKKDQPYKILDVGCGIGELLRDIQRTFPQLQLQLTGIDFSPGMIARAQSLSEGISYQEMDVNNLGVWQERFDIIICTHSFPYYQKQREALKDFQQLLGPQGRLLLAQAFQNNLYDKLALFFVKFTTGQAHYPSVQALEKMAQGLFALEKVILIKEKFYMPSIFLFILKGGEQH